jgi:hypothetical protein
VAAHGPRVPVGVAEPRAVEFEVVSVAYMNLSALARKFAHVFAEGSGGEGGGLGVGLGEKLVKVLAREFPLERRSDLLVMTPERE